MREMFKKLKEWLAKALFGRLSEAEIKVNRQKLINSFGTPYKESK